MGPTEVLRGLGCCCGSLHFFFCLDHEIEIDVAQDVVFSDSNDLTQQSLLNVLLLAAFDRCFGKSVNPLVSFALRARMESWA